MARARRVCAVLLLLASSSAGAAAKHVVEPSAALATRLQELEKRRVDLRTFIWTVYPATGAFGSDGRGRTLGEDLNQWVLPEDVRARLDGLFRGAESLQRSADPKAAATMDAVQDLLLEQKRRIELVAAYWTQHVLLNRQRDAWADVAGRVPPALATASRARLDLNERKLLQDYAARLSLDVVGGDIEALKITYNRERLSLAAVLGEQAAPAPLALLPRVRWRPCPAGAASTATAAADSKVKILAAAPTDKFFPEYARSASISGRVLVQAIIDVQGCMVQAKVVQTAGLPMLDDAAIDLLEYTRFAAEQVKGKPVRATVTIPVVFKFDSDSALGDAGAPDVKHLNELIDKGYAAMNRGDYYEALIAFDAALDLEPNSSIALADRGLVHSYRREYTAARADLDAAQAINPNNAVVYRGRGILAWIQGDFAATIVALNHSLELDPNSSFAFYYRCLAYTEQGNTAAALADCGQAVHLQPGYLNARTLRAALFRATDDATSAMAQATELIATKPEAEWVHVPAGFIYSASGDDVRAAQEFAQALALKPTERNYVSRAFFRHLLIDDSGAAQDLHAALEINPTHIAALLRLSELQLDTGDYTAALDTAQKGLELKAADPGFLVLRAIAQTQLKRSDLAQQDLALAQTSAATSSQLNTLCWTLAIYNLALQEALTACDAAVAAEPRASNIADSRAFVLMRLSRYDESIRQYDVAIANSRVTASSYYGRGLAKRFKGDLAGALADLRYARKLDAHVGAIYVRMGFKP